MLLLRLWFNLHCYVFFHCTWWLFLGLFAFIWMIAHLRRPSTDPKPGRCGCSRRVGHPLMFYNFWLHNVLYILLVAPMCHGSYLFVCYHSLLQHGSGCAAFYRRLNCAGPITNTPSVKKKSICRNPYFESSMPIIATSRSHQSPISTQSDN